MLYGLLMLVSEADVKGFRNKYQLPVCKIHVRWMDIPTGNMAKNLIRTPKYGGSPGVRERLFHAVINGNFGGLAQTFQLTTI